MIRLGGPVFEPFTDTDSWIASLRASGYRAAYCPADASADQRTIDEIVRAAQAADIVIAEVGAWSNPISPDSKIRGDAIARCKAQLTLADRVGANCCVNIAGSRGEQWDGPHPDNFSEDTFDLIVRTVREIIDDVDPRRTFYALETMPWIYPDSPDSYLRLIAAIDRRRFAVHLDPANMISSPRRFYSNAGFIRECFDKLGPHIRSCHAKDIAFGSQMTVHLDEVRPGLGGLDYRAFLREADRLSCDIPVMLEHLPTPSEYMLAAQHVRSVAEAVGIVL